MAKIITYEFTAYPYINAHGKRETKRGKVWVRLSTAPEHDAEVYGVSEWAISGAEFYSPKRAATPVETAKIEKWLRENATQRNAIEDALREALRG